MFSINNPRHFFPFPPGVATSFRAIPRAKNTAPTIDTHSGFGRAEPRVKLDHFGQGAATRGRLHIFLGAAPGVGKTYAMLGDARARQARGADVVIGRVETHGFPDNVALCRGIDAVPALEREPPNRDRDELDTDAVIRRRPGLVLIDDLAHRNPEGQRHFHRWQDVEQILDHGIDVHATLNVQHLASLKDLVSDLTGIRIRDAVPDAVLEKADQVTLVDVAPIDLLDRLRDGKVFLADPDRMLRDYFREDHLASLRALALQKAAEHLESRRRAQRNKAQGARWHAERRVLVCITNGPGGERLVRAGKRLATFLHADWTVAYLETAKDERLSPAQREQLHGCLRLAEELGAEIETLSGFGMDRRIIALARERNVGRIVLERPAGRLLYRWRHGGIARALERHAPDLDVFLLSTSHSSLIADSTVAGTLAAAPFVAPTFRRPKKWLGYVWAAGVTVLATLVSTSLFGQPEPTNHLILYLLGVLFIASRFGFWPSAAAALMATLSSDYLHMAPIYALGVDRREDAITLTVFMVAALVASRLTANLRFLGERARQRERRVQFLYEFTRALADVRTAQDLASVAEQHIARELPWQCRLVLFDGQGRAPIAAEPAGKDTGGGAGQWDEQAIHWVFVNRRPAGWGTDTGTDDGGLYLPISGPQHRHGVLALRPTRESFVLLPEQRRMIGTVVNQISQSLERIRLTQEANAATARVEAESLRNSLLSAIAHDFRTPLASIVAASSTLLEGTAHLSPEQSRDLAQTILEEGRRMTDLANNTLEMARLEAGGVVLRREWYPLDEIVGAALSRMEDRLHDRTVVTHLPPGVPMAQVDVVMIVRVLENLIENAIKYAPPGSTLELGATDDGRDVAFWVADDGPGLAPGEDRKIFEKFYRGAGKEAQSGVGLGLTICRIVVEAHGGRIDARNRPGGGAEFRFTVPGTEPPPQFPSDE